MTLLVLFDIDETMIKSDGAGRRALNKALSKVAPVPIQSTSVTMSGKTDPQICREILLVSKVQEKDIDWLIGEAFKIYPQILEEEIQKAESYTLLKGVCELIDALSSIKNNFLGLLTGNIEPGARLKLAPFDLNQYFPVGAFGSDSANRMELPAIAAQRATSHYQRHFSNQQVVIIGDSILDVQCAKGFGAVSIAVNTGKTSKLDLISCQPDFLFPSLENTKAVLRAISCRLNTVY